MPLNCALTVIEKKTNKPISIYRNLSGYRLIYNTILFIPNLLLHRLFIFKICNKLFDQIDGAFNSQNGAVDG